MDGIYVMFEAVSDRLRDRGAGAAELRRANEARDAFLRLPAAGHLNELLETLNDAGEDDQTGAIWFLVEACVSGRSGP